MKQTLSEKQLLRRIRLITVFFILALIVSGITAFPIETELNIFISILGIENSIQGNDFENWIYKIIEAISETNEKYPFLAYGYDWLAFAHIIIAIAFGGVYFKPVRNVWIVYWAMIACILVIPLAFICGSVRGIPIFWILIDCSFGIFGIIPLLYLRKYINEIARISGCYVPTKH